MQISPAMSAEMTHCDPLRGEITGSAHAGPACDFAPMEGITEHSFRAAHSSCFPGMDRYYAPFIAANRSCSLKTREKEDVAPENNSGVILVPQILTNVPEVFAWAARQMLERGYRTVNLNLGCPSQTVCSHGKGAGFLADPARLDAFFEKTFALLHSESELSVSVKTRIGVSELSEAEALLAVFNRYPIAELIVHPRLRVEFYKGKPHLDIYGLFYEGYRGNLTYNGDIRCEADLRELLARFPATKRVMIGRGLLTNPALVRGIRGGGPLQKEELRAFHDDLFRRRLVALQGFHNTAGKMKELWYYLGALFPDSARLIKKVKKARTQEEYWAATRELFDGCSEMCYTVPNTLCDC